MENSQSLATDSFSYSWLLIDKKPLLPENSSEKEQNFNFDIPVTNSHTVLVHADEIFSQGLIMPVYVERSKVEFLDKLLPESRISSKESPNCSQEEAKRRFIYQKEFGSDKKWRKSSKRILQRFFLMIFKPIYKLIGCSGKNNRIDDLERKVCEVQSWSNSLMTSQRTSSVYSPRLSSTINNQYDAESSINEAILYCKRSIEK